MFQHLPQHLRAQELTRLKGCRALRYPAAYGLKTSKHWIVVEPLNQEGIVTKTIKDKQLFDSFVTWLKTNNIPYEIVQL